MRFPTKEELKNLRERFPKAAGSFWTVWMTSRRQSQEPGVCRGVDDAGNVLASWDTGGSLSVAFGADTCHRVASDEEIRKSLGWFGKSRHRGAHCPRCGVCEEPANRLLALSRRADITVCESCGTAEALEYAGLMERKGLSDWWIVKKGWVE